MIIVKVKEAKNFWEKCIGNIGRSDITPYLFKTRFGIHTLGMKKAIDLVVLDKNNTVVGLKENLKPANVFFWNMKYDQVLELEAGFIGEKKIRIGDSIKLILDNPDK